MKIWGLTIDDSIQYPDNLAEAITERWRSRGKDIIVTPYMVKSIVDKFSEREREMLLCRFGKYLTLQNIGKQYNVSGERVRQIIMRAARRIIAKTARI